MITEERRTVETYSPSDSASGAVLVIGWVVVAILAAGLAYFLFANHTVSTVRETNTVQTYPVAQPAAAPTAVFPPAQQSPAPVPQTIVVPQPVAVPVPTQSTSTPAQSTTTTTDTTTETPPASGQAGE